eukprot:s2449_g5.t1
MGFLQGCVTFNSLPAGRPRQQLQNLWGDLAAYTPYFLLWGMRSLLSSFSFYALSQYFIDGLSFGYIVHFFYLILAVRPDWAASPYANGISG